MINKGKFKTFFKRNYEYYIILVIILFSFTLNMSSIFSNLTDNLPCFIKGLGEFIGVASFHIAFFTGINAKLLDLLIPGYGIFLTIIFENVFGSIVIFGTYYLGKKVFMWSNNKQLNRILKILLVIYVIVLFNALIVNPIARCLLRIG